MIFYFLFQLKSCCKIYGNSFSTGAISDKHINDKSQSAMHITSDTLYEILLCEQLQLYDLSFFGIWRRCFQTFVLSAFHIAQLVKFIIEVKTQVLYSNCMFLPFRYPIPGYSQVKCKASIITFCVLLPLCEGESAHTRRQCPCYSICIL